MSGHPQAVPAMQVDSAEMIVTEWHFIPGAETGHHRHGHGYMMVPLTDGTLLLRIPEGDRHAPLVAGQACFRKAGVKHNMINTSAREVVFAEAEIK